MESQHIYSYIYLTLALLMASGSAKAQEKANYILTKTKIASNSKNIMTYDFFDGLGRETIKATNGIGNGDEFIYSFKEITGEQTMTRNWLPVVGGNTIAIPDVNEINQKASAQYGDSHAYEEYEHDILGRLRKQYKAGHAWKSNPISISYVTNSDNEVIKYKITTAKGIKPDGDRYYKKGTLLGICTIDEDGIKTTTYTDVFGKKILERRGTDNDTYYIYDEFGRIAFVTMPGLKERFILNKNAFQYCEYDISGNLTKKRLPGCYFITYSYDKYNRCTSMQDGELLKKGLYRFMLYDNMGRLAVQGLLTKQPYIDNGLVYYSRGSGGIGGTDYNMLDGTAFRLPIAAIEIVNYYDDYDFLNGASRDLFQNTIQPVSSYAKGRVAGSIVLASNGEKIAVLNSYDQLGNLATIWKRGLDGIVEKTECTYTYTNKIAASSVTVSHTKGASVEFHANNSYNPNNDRLASITRWAKVDTASTGQFTVSYSYDRLGRLSGISRPVKGGMGSLAFDYDIHGWLTSIESGSFCEKLHYHDGLGTPLYNGNISSITWKGRNAPHDRGYRFTYDDLSRVVSSEYGENNFTKLVGKYDERTYYDRNGNITHLVRNGMRQDGSIGSIDDLQLKYDGNLLESVEERAPAILNVNSLDVKRSSQDIRYNNNGSLKCDGTRGITNIVYDNSNNPVRIQFDNGNVTKYVYSATGQKLRSIHYTAAPNIHVSMDSIYNGIEENFLTVDSMDYMAGGSIVYANNAPSMILFDGGYIGASYAEGLCYGRPVRHPGMTDEEYQGLLEKWMKLMNTQTLSLDLRFYTKDHLGNNREVIDTEGNVCQSVDYYPFGTPYSDGESAMLATGQQYKYNGKELDPMHGLNTYDYGARQYNPILPRWDRIDPLAEKYYNVSPYTYCEDNPIRYIDPNGKEKHDGVGEKNNNNKKLHIMAKEIQDDPNAIVIVAHGVADNNGSINSFNFKTYNKKKNVWENHYISNGKDFDKLLTSISPLWRNYKAGKSPSPKIVLFACGTNKVAERISQTESFNGIDIIAPNDNVLAWPQNGYLPIVGHQVKISTDNYSFVMGEWITYRNGSETWINGRYDGVVSPAPGTKNFDYEWSPF